MIVPETVPVGTEILGAYRAAGFRLVPLHPVEKRPKGLEWQTRPISDQELIQNLSRGGGVGIQAGECSGWLCAVDLDCDEARKLAHKFLPATLTSGKEGEQLPSHYVYISEGLDFAKFADVDNTTLIDLKAAANGQGHQFVVEPSIHESKGRYLWSGGFDPAKIRRISHEDLERRVRKLAAAVLVARHYPAPGHGRHDAFGLPLAGYLLRHNEDEEDGGRIVKAARKLQPEPMTRETESRIEGAFSSTAKKLADGDKKVSGGPTLNKTVPGLAGKLADTLGWGGASADMGEGPRSQGGAADDKRNQADRLIQYALDTGAPLFVDHLGEEHVLVRETQAVPLNSRCYSWLRDLMWKAEHRSVTGESLKTAAGTLAAFASRSGDVRTLYTRSAFYEGRVYYWLGAGRIAEIGAQGWRVLDNAPVLFRTIPNLRELPNPSGRGSFDALDNLVNLKSERDRRLLRAYLVTLPLEHVQRPILQPTGVMGSGKSTACRAIKRTLDPSAPESVRIDPRDFLQKASHSYIVMLDNQNSLPEWAVDMLCRLVTGEADSKRRHYTNDEDFIYELKRAILLNGINAPSDRGDVQDRTLPIELERIPDTVRRDEESLWEEFEAAHPAVLGAIFDTLSGALRGRAGIKLHKRPRLADWGYYAAAVYEACGWGTEKFLSDWAGVVASQNQETLEGSAVAQTILAVMAEHETYKASTTRLLEVLETEADKLSINIKKDKTWPKSPSWVWRRIKEVLPLLNAHSISAYRTETKTGSEITLARGPDGGSIIENAATGGSIMPGAATDAATNNPPEVSQEDENDQKGGSSGSIYGSPDPSLTSEEKEEKEGVEGSNTHTPRELPADAATAATAATEDKKEHSCAFPLPKDGSPMRCRKCGITYKKYLERGRKAP